MKDDVQTKIDIICANIKRYEYWLDTQKNAEIYGHINDNAVLADITNALNKEYRELDKYKINHPEYFI